MAGQRKAAEKSGRFAESLAALYLQLKGYRILARRSRTALGELDLIAQKGRRIIMVEVKKRRSLAAALDAVTAKQRQRIERAALLWLQKNHKMNESVRFDVIAIVPWRFPTHIKDAWAVSLQAKL